MGYCTASRTNPKGNTVELAVTYCRGGDCEFVPPLRRGGRGGDFPAEARGIASPRNPPVSPLRKGGNNWKPCSGRTLRLVQRY